MRALLVILVVLCAAGCASEPSRQADLTSAAADVASSGDLQAISARGVEIYQRDQSAWVATDAMLAAFDDPAGAGLRGWVTEPAGEESWRTIFVVERDGALYPAFETQTSGHAVTESHVSATDAPALAAPLVLQHRAIRAAMESNPEGFCGPQLNSVAIPIGDAQTPDAFDVYLLSATSQLVIPAGGHVRVRVKADDLSVVEQERFSTSCMTLDIKPNVAAYYLTSNVGETPSEIHVFLSLTYDTPFAVGTSVNGQTWMVEGSRIAPLGEDAPK